MVQWKDLPQKLSPTEEAHLTAIDAGEVWFEVLKSKKGDLEGMAMFPNLTKLA